MSRLEDFLKLNKNRQIWTISKDQSVMQALILMSEKNIGAIVIIITFLVQKCTNVITVKIHN